MEVPVYLLAVFLYALFGATLSAFYLCCERLRREPVLHLVSLFAAFVASVWGASTTLSRNPESISENGIRFFAFLLGTLFYVPYVVFLGVHYWGIVVDRIMSPGNRSARTLASPRTSREWWGLLHVTITELKEKPHDVRLRLRLAKTYEQLGYFTSAAHEYARVAEWLPNGYAHSHVLYKAGHLLVEKSDDVDRALPILRRVVRLYPKSYFASYARRVINRYEARQSDRESRKTSRHE